jgi:hypothetical protein
VSDDLVQSVNQKICERQRFTFQNICVNLDKFHTLFTSKMGMENAHRYAQNEENGFFGLEPLLEQYQEDGNEFLSHIIQGAVS